MTNPLIGNLNEFAIDWGITRPYESASLLALGWFTVWLKGKQFGVKSPEATMLACSFDEVKKRISDRGTHTAIFSKESASSIVAAYRSVRYEKLPSFDDILGLSKHKVEDELLKKKIQWCPDGDEAFDDGSHILQFDLDKEVRLIGFNNSEYKTDTYDKIVDLWIPSDHYYGLLTDWINVFTIERRGLVISISKLSS
jgi:hypothetical protein